MTKATRLFSVRLRGTICSRGLQEIFVGYRLVTDPGAPFALRRHLQEQKNHPDKTYDNCTEEALRKDMPAWPLYIP